MRALTCASLIVGLILVTCAGCDTGVSTKKPSVSAPATPQGTGPEGGEPGVQADTQTTTGEVPAATETKAGDAEKKSDETNAAEKKSEDK